MCQNLKKYVEESLEILCQNQPPRGNKSSWISSTSNVNSLAPIDNFVGMQKPKIHNPLYTHFHILNLKVNRFLLLVSSPYVFFSEP